MTWETPLMVLWGGQVTLGMAVTALALVVAALLLGLAAAPKGGDKSKKGPAAQAGRSPSDDAFVKGVAHLMADHTDQAIEEFTRAVTLNSDTVETYVVLGNLFRQKGEIDRAVRIRQTIIARPNLNPLIKLQAIYDLGLDYKKGGLYNRAVEAFEEVLSNDSGHVEACRQIVSLYEEMRDWERAFQSLKRLDRLNGKDNRHILAHYRTEQGKELMAAGQLDQAEDSLNAALNVHKGCLDAYLHLGDLELTRDRPKKALAAWRKAVKLAPTHAHLVVRRVDEAVGELGEKAVTGFLDEIEPGQAEANTLLALAECCHKRGDDQRALEMLTIAVEKEPTRLEAHRLRGEILLSGERGQEALSAYGELLRQIHGTYLQFQCGQCGFVSHQLTWKCPRCHSWDTMSPREI